MFGSLNGLNNISGLGSTTPVSNELVPFWFDGLSVGNLDNSANWQEISGMATPQKAANANYLWVISDSPANMLACVLASNGSNQGVYTLTNPPAYSDWEDLSSGTVNGQPYLYVADFGDNGNARATFNIFRIKEPTITGAGGAIAEADYETITIRYAIKEANKGKTAAQIMQDAKKEKVWSDWKLDVETRIKAGYAPEIAEVFDNAATNKRQERYDYLRKYAPFGNPKHPQTIEMLQLKEDIANGSVKKKETRLVHPDGRFLKIPQLVYDRLTKDK